jgi:hypothetical protein
MCTVLLPPGVNPIAVKTDNKKLYSFFNLGARRGWVPNVTPQPLNPGNSPDAHWRGLDGPQGAVCTGVVQKKRRGLTGDQTPDVPARSESLY